MAFLRSERLPLNRLEPACEFGDGGLVRSALGFLEVRRAQIAKLALDSGMLRFETGETPALVGRRGAKRLAARVEVGRCGLSLREFGLRALKFSPGARLALARFSREAVGPIGGLGQRQVLGGEPLRHGGGVGDQRLLALEVAGELGDAALELGFALLGALLLGLERVARERDPVQRRAAARLLFAQGRKAGGGDRLQARGLGLGARALGDLEKVGVEPPSRLGEMGLVLAPGDEMGERLMTADVGGEIAVTARLARLTLQAVDLDVELLQHVLDAQKVVLRPFQPQLRLVAARVQARNAGRLLEDEPARLGLGGDDLADLALAHERGRARAGRGVGEEELHVARAHLLAVDAIGRARLALDAPRNLDRLGVVERGGRAAVGIVEQEGDFGVVARGALAGAAENDVLHARAAHVLERRLAHHPAQRLDQIRLAAAVGTDDAGQARLDLEIGRIAEALEAGQAQALEFHRRRPSTLEPAGGFAHAPAAVTS